MREQQHITTGASGFNEANDNIDIGTDLDNLVMATSADWDIVARLVTKNDYLAQSNSQPWKGKWWS